MVLKWKWRFTLLTFIIYCLRHTDTQRVAGDIGMEKKVKRNKIPKPASLRGVTEYTFFVKQIDNSRVSDIAAVLKNNTSLKSLGFRGWVGDEGAKAIASSLCDNNTLERLSFDSTRVGYSGVLALSRAISVHSPLTYLSLMYCPLQDNAVQLLIPVLALPTCRLEVLRLDHCPQISNATGELIFKTLFDNRSSRMQTVGLKGTGVNEKVQREIRLLLLPGGRSFDKHTNPSMEAAAYLTTKLGVDKSELKTLHGFVENIGPLCSATRTVVTTAPLPRGMSVPSSYKKYGYRSGGGRVVSSAKKYEYKTKREVEREEQEETMELNIAKNHLRPLLRDEERRKQAASLSNIRMLLKLNSTLAKKMEKRVNV